MLFRNISYANVTATLALFIALGGTSYAAVMVTGSDVKNGSLTGRDIGNNSLNGRDVQGIQGWDIADGAVKSRDIADHSIMAGDLHASVLFAGAKGEAGATGAKGDTGADGTNGAKGDTGAPGADGTVGAKGDTGAPGADGRDGADGSSIVNRTRSTGPATPAAANTRTPIPLTANSWTQAADQVDQLVGIVDYTPSADCSGYSAVAIVMQSVNGGAATEIGSAYLSGGSGTYGIQFYPRASNFEPGSATENTLTATVADGCPSGHQTVNSLKVDVIAAR
jgi:collagen triple helix repeat protein